MLSRLWKPLEPVAKQTIVILGLISTGVFLLLQQPIIAVIILFVSVSVAIILVLAEKNKEINKLRTENAELTQPPVDFIVTFNEPNITNLYIYDPKLRKFKNGTFDFVTSFTIQNTRVLGTGVKFSIVKIETDLPVIDDPNIFELQMHKSAGGKTYSEIFHLEQTEFTQAVFRIKVQMELDPHKEKLHQIGTATHFRVIVDLIQADKSGSPTRYVLELENPATKFTDKIEEQITTWIQEWDDSQQYTYATSAKDVVEYLKLIWGKDK